MKTCACNCDVFNKLIEKEDCNSYLLDDMQIKLEFYWKKKEKQIMSEIVKCWIKNFKSNNILVKDEIEEVKKSINNEEI